MDVGERREARQLAFLMPGIVHNLGNQLFSIQGHAQLLGRNGKNPSQERRTILEAAERAEQTLRIVRCLSGVGGAEVESTAGQAGILISRLCALCKVPLRERGVTVRLEHSSHETPRLVDAAQLVRSLTEVLRALCARLPAGVEGELVVDLCQQHGDTIAIRLRMQLHPSFLPFPLDFPGVRSDVIGYLEEHGVQMGGPSAEGMLELRLPVAPGVG